jgi:hypothetical protein
MDGTPEGAAGRDPAAPDDHAELDRLERELAELQRAVESSDDGSQPDAASPS